MTLSYYYTRYLLPLRFLGLVALLSGTLLLAENQENDALSYYDPEGLQTSSFPELPKAFKYLKSNRKFDDNVRELVKTLRKDHFIHPKVKENATEIVDTYLDSFDSSKRFFIQKDIEWFDSKRKYLKKAVSNGKAKHIFLVHNLYRERFSQTLLAYIHLIDHHQFDFYKEESLETNRKKASFPTSISQWYDLRRKEIKNALLSRILDDHSLEEAKVALRKRYVNRLEYFLDRDHDVVLDKFANAILKHYDPHSRYLTPENYKSFVDQQSLQLDGIGAFIGSRDDYIEVFRLVENGPAKRSGLLFPGDRIIGVAEGDAHFKDVVGMSTNNVVKLIRGKKNSTVRLEVISAGKSFGAPSRIVPIKRDSISMTENRAYQQIVTLPGIDRKWKIGIITVQSFYGAFSSRAAPSAAADVAALTNYLKKQEVDGIVLDLRGNGGGLLSEAINMAGVFLPRGPVVRIKKNNGKTLTHGNVRNLLIWDGPLAVLVNRLSASASEIVAAAIQDYQRGIIVGSTTYGKGTVQSPHDIQGGAKGRAFLTISKFYRINGGSTQNKGVIPNVLLPNLYNSEDVGESALEHPLPWDSIDHANFRTINQDWFDEKEIAQLQATHNYRKKQIPYLTYIENILAKREETERKTLLPLHRDQRQAKLEKDKADSLKAENDYRTALNKSTFADWEALEAFRLQERQKENRTGTEADLEVRVEAARVLIDSLHHSMLSPTTAK